MRFQRLFGAIVLGSALLIEFGEAGPLRQKEPFLCHAALNAFLIAFVLVRDFLIVVLPDIVIAGSPATLRKKADPGQDGNTIPLGARLP